MLVEIAIDLSVAIDVVAGGEHIDTGGKELICHRRSDAHTSRRVLAVGHHHIGGVTLAQSTKTALE
jgi:hypothetical protein